MGTFLVGIDKESDMQANLQIGLTLLGMVWIYVEGDGIEIQIENCRRYRTTWREQTIGQIRHVTLAPDLQVGSVRP